MAELLSISDRFLGLWTIERDILDLDSEWIGRFDGQARFAPVNSGLHYREEGQLAFGGLESMTATREYIWRFPGGRRIEVMFEDGSPFHAFDMGRGRAEATHFCDPDQYDVAYDFSRWPEWRAEWRVEGPRKDYRMVSIYRRPS